MIFIRKCFQKGFILPFSKNSFESMGEL